MNLKELDSFKLSDAIAFHDKLNPKLFRGNKLIPLVKDQLKTIADDFITELGIKDVNVRDITISGSNAAYTYTPHSDLDLHILVNIKDLPQSDVYKELFNAKKNLYNDSHDISIHDVPVELYVQDANEPVKSLGEYSVLNDKWLRIPTKRRANFDQTATKSKYNKLYELVRLVLKSKDLNKVNKVLKKLKQYRQAGLDKGGEFSPENLAYKALRSQGYITNLYSLRDKLHSEKLSIEGMYSKPKKSDKLTDDLRKEFEDYDPNGPPPGPEFKPTMPAGTVRVDVSDVYDWYKLGQHISNMKGLGKHDFGKGPPSTIMAFGSEPEEHKYIKYLEKTGLTTTDIDPIDKNQPKGMKRQKVDPTYNVNEIVHPDVTAKRYFIEPTKNVRMGDFEFNARTFTGSRADFDARGIQIRAYDPRRPKGSASIGSADFIVKSDNKGNQWLESDDTEVDEDYRGVGVASMMYAFAKSLGNDIKPSTYQSQMGREMWGKWGKDAKHLAKEGVAEGTEPDYMAGHCHVMALAFKKLNPVWKIRAHIGWDEDAEDDSDYRVDHVYIVAPDGSAYDCRGKFSNEQELVGPDETGGVETQFVDYSIDDIKHDVARGELKRFGKEDLARAVKFIQSKQGVAESASGYIPSNAEKDDPRFKTALTVDIKPDTMKKDAKKFGNKISRAGIPPTLKASGKF